VSLQFCTETEQNCSKGVTRLSQQATLKGMQAIELLEPIGPTPSVQWTKARFVRNSDLVSRNVSGETVVVPICRGVGDLDCIYTFNSVGTHLWSLLAVDRTVMDLSAAVAQRFAVSAELAQSDVENFLAELQEVGLVRTV